MLTSILHRATGIALYGALVGLALWLMAAAAGPATYALVEAVLTGPLGQAALYLLVVAFAYHLANGLRHLMFDTGAGLKPAAASASSWMVILFALAAPVTLWLVLNGGVQR
jgi:succinate dehydrogenase / fumarate reductase cytochrome b subunit